MIEDLKQQIEKIRIITKEKIAKSKKKEEEAIEEEEKQKTFQLEEIKQEIFNNTNLMKDNIKNYHQKLLNLLSFFQFHFMNLFYDLKPMNEIVKSIN